MKQLAILTGVLTALIAILVSVGAVTRSAAATSYPCFGAPPDQPVASYPEPRVFLESQSWTEPQPGSTLQGHIHVGTCFPLYGTHTGTDPIAFDTQIQGHNRTQPINYGYRIDEYDTNSWIDHLSLSPPTCIDNTPGNCFQTVPAGTQNVEWIHTLWPTDPSQCGVHDSQCGANSSGTHALYMFAMSQWDNGNADWPYATAWINIQNGAPFVPPAGDNLTMLGGESEFTTPSDQGGKYARAFIDNADYQKAWDPATGAKPLSGIWTIHTHAGDSGFNDFRVLIDPHLHATPPDNGMVIQLDGSPGTFNIDTTRLTDGVHYLLLATRRQDKVGSDVTWWGVLKVPFLVQNGGSPPPTTTTTTSTTTTVPPPPTTTTTVPTSQSVTKTIGTASDSAAVGTAAWYAPERATAQDDSWSVAGVDNNVATHFLVGTMGSNAFSVPAGATIDGVKVDAVVSRGGNRERDATVMLVKGGSPVGVNKADTTNWPAPGTKTWGGPADLWGTTLTPADVNSPNFGVAISGQNVNDGSGRVLMVDSERITVYYH